MSAAPDSSIQADSQLLANAFTDNIHYEQQIEAAVYLAQNLLQKDLPLFSGASPAVLRQAFSLYKTCPEHGQALNEVLNSSVKQILLNSIQVQNPKTCAHLHCPPLNAAIAAETLLSTWNPSMDSWDQAPAATIIEQKLIEWLCEQFDYPDTADGVFTSGGTQSNTQALLLARDRCISLLFDHDVQQAGLPAAASRLRILCSQAAHFSIQQAASVLGLGHKAVIAIPTDDQGRMQTVFLRQVLAHMQCDGLIPMAIVATAGTTDLGAIDPLTECAAIATENRCWLHVDAAYGGALAMLSNNTQLSGIDLADSITVDFHKAFFQPISCGALILRQKRQFSWMRRHADYLNREEDIEPNLVEKSLATSRRFDALKLWISLQNLGHSGFSCLIQRLLDLTQAVAAEIDRHPHFELYTQPSLSTVVFRYLTSPDRSDMLNQSVRRRLFDQQQAVIAQTKCDGKVYLKFTLLNPNASLKDFQKILAFCCQHTRDIA